MFKLFLPAFAMVIIIGSLAGALVWYWNLPVVAINSEGQCVWMQKHAEREPCPDQLPRKYVDVRVQ